MPISFGAGGTLGDVVDEVISNVQGFTASPDPMTYLLADISATDVSLKVADASNISRGLIEIGNELIWVTNVDSASGTLTVLPKGRGWKGSPAAAHSANDTVVVSPAVPRYIVCREINNEIASLYPSIFGVQTTEFTYNSVIQAAWPLPSGTEIVLDVRYKDFLGNWQRIRGWEIEQSSDTTDFPSGVSLRLTERIPISLTVQVVYAVQPVPMASEDVAWSTTGLSAGSGKDIVVLGAMCRALPMLDVSRLSVQYVPADELNQPRPLGSAMGLVKELRNTYQQRVLQERTALAQRYPARCHLTR